MIDKDINFEKTIKTKEVIGKKNYLSCDFLIKVNGKIFNSEEDYNFSRTLSKHLQRAYLAYFKNLCPEGYIVIVRLSGLHIELVELISKYSFSNDSRNQAVFHYHHWQTTDKKATDEEAFMIIRCDASLFDQLFEKYWFCIGMEYRFEGIILKPEDSVRPENLNLIHENEEDRTNLIDSVFMIFDNLNNGFHFQITTSKKTSIFLENSEPCISKEWVKEPRPPKQK